MLELMHFPEELLDASEFKAPVEKAVGKAEMQMAKHPESPRQPIHFLFK